MSSEGDVGLLRQERQTRRRLTSPTEQVAAARLGAAGADREGDTSAKGGRTGGRNGTAAATARYSGDIGFARTDSRSGVLNLARGVAVGVDEHGLSLSVSNALAPRRGPAIATNFNVSIGTNGDVSHSAGVAIASGSRHRSVAAGGTATTAQGGRNAVFASGATGASGRVRALTDSDDHRPRAAFGYLRRGGRRVLLVKRRRTERRVRAGHPAVLRLLSRGRATRR